MDILIALRQLDCGSEAKTTVAAAAVEIERLRADNEILLDYLWQIWALPEDSRGHARVAKKALTNPYCKDDGRT